jgi:hypothetical protein
MLFKISNPELVIKHIKKLQPLNYNQFRWWRQFDSKTKLLPKGASLQNRIKNKEFEFSHYYWQAQYCEMRINEKVKSYDGDIQRLIENDGVELARRKRLWEDFEKNESENLQELQKLFLREFIITPEEYDEHIINFDGTLGEFYMYCLKTFDLSGKKADKRGRPPKQKSIY